jgi:hypothetical protein
MEWPRGCRGHIWAADRAKAARNGRRERCNTEPSAKSVGKAYAELTEPHPR